MPHSGLPVAVTGGTGLLGSHLVAHIANLETEAAVVIRDPRTVRRLDFRDQQIDRQGGPAAKARKLLDRTLRLRWSQR